MTISYLLRHGRTPKSRAYIADGKPATPTPLDAVGILQCRRVGSASWPTMIATCVVSEFARTHQTADLIVGPDVRRFVEPRLNEISYGVFDGGPWMNYGAWLATNGIDAYPPGGESRRAAVLRILLGLRHTLTLPGPRLVVGHGLMISMLLQLLRCGSLDTAGLPASPYVRPLPLADQHLRELIDAGRQQATGGAAGCDRSNAANLR